MIKKEMDPATRQAYIDKIMAMNQMDMAKMWRFAPSGDPIFDCQYDLFEIFQKRFRELGGMTPALSKAIGW